MARSAPPRRVFLDAGVLVEGCCSLWGASKALLILTTYRLHYTIVLADVTEQVVLRALIRKANLRPQYVPQDLMAAYHGWLTHARIERVQVPPADLLARNLPLLLPVIRHRNDLPAVVSAIQAQADWIISTNTAHWTPALGAAIGITVASPEAFLLYLSSIRP